MEAFFLPLGSPLFRFFFIGLLLCFASCKQQKQKIVQRSFYYWKTVFNLTDKEEKTLHSLSVNHLYVKLFDVAWNETLQGPIPVAPTSFQETLSGIVITPVVFITHETLQKSNAVQLDALAINLVKLLSSICANNHLTVSDEVQIDCDWTANTKDKYFRLLQKIRVQDFIKNKKISATIRLHQLKFVSQNGVPPVDKGLLMCYNMGNLKHPQTRNSIIELSELKKYTGNLKNYPLPLDVALPIFDWYVWFRNNEYKGLMHTFSITNKERRISFPKDTVVSGVSFTAEDWLRYEGSTAEEIIDAAKHLSQSISKDSINVILYHLDENNLSKYKKHELENMFNSFR